MQAVESETLILYHTDLRGQWPEEAVRAFAAQLPYARRLALRAASSTSRASLAGIALALRALALLLGRRVHAGEILFAQGEKPRLAPPAAVASGEARFARRGVEPRGERAPADFSISHAGPWVACAALAHGRVGLDLEIGSDERIAQWVLREALLKASGEGLRALHEVRDLAMHEDRVRWRGALWHVRRLGDFEGASACVVSSCQAPVESYALALAELFAI